MIRPHVIDESTARGLVVRSYIAPDIRNSDHAERGYIPCRVFKNISYGKVPATNSQHVATFFSEQLPFASDMDELFDVNVNASADPKMLKTLSTVHSEVRNKHTDINRIETIMNCF